MRDAIKTIILVVILSVAGFAIIAINDNIQKGVELLSRTKLPFDDPTIQILYPKVQNNTFLRKADLDTTSLSNEEIIEYVFDNLTKDDYKVKRYEATKIYCCITYNIEFTTERDSCDITIINNSKFMEYQKDVFNTERELSFNDINYKGYNCKNDGSKYYCVYTKYNDPIVGYSVFKDAYEDKEGVVIHEYYLSINLSKTDRCLNYFNNEYCSNYANSERPPIDEEVIKRDGVLYEHLFVKDEDNYYLKRSFIVSE